MPRGDGTGPFEQGPGMGKGQGRGRGMGGGKGSGMGPSGDCMCPSCGQKTPHKPGNPCAEVKCPSCGTAMLRG